jgi:hypothetical protein
MCCLNCHPGRVVPRIEKIVYSTCSIHPEENEQVVAAALRSTEAIAGGFRLAPRSAVLPEWPRRGQPGNLDDPGWLLWLIWPPHGARQLIKLSVKPQKLSCGAHPRKILRMASLFRALYAIVVHVRARKKPKRQSQSVIMPQAHRQLRCPQKGRYTVRIMEIASS